MDQDQLERDITEMQRLMCEFERMYSESVVGSERESRCNRVRLGLRRWVSRGQSLKEFKPNDFKAVKRVRKQPTKKVSNE